MATIKLIGDAPNQVSRNRDLGDLAYQDAGALNQIGVNGVKFLGTASTDANTLDAYEEGTWTPIYNTTNGDLTNFIYFQNAGKYTKVGNIVTVQCNIATSQTASISGTGYVIVTGLPFAPSTGGAGINFTALTIDNRFTNNPSFGQVANGQTTVYLYKTSAMNVANALVVADMKAIASANYNLLGFCVTYQVA